MKILIVEDDEATAQYVEKGLREAGHITDHCSNGSDGLAMALSSEFDVIVLDRMLPQIDGLSVLKTLRSQNNRTPVLLLSALGQTDHRVEGLQSGADDYLAKPFAFSELLARLEAIQRRNQPVEAIEMSLTVGPLSLDLVTRLASRDGHDIALLPREFQILEYMMRNPGRVITRTMLLEHVWGYHFDPQTNVTDVHISRLRKKIDGEAEVQLIKTVRGAGYCLSA
ncbi:response regulator transcription factor [Cochlodiniinecator piscidefendens]|uniref:response regulator transcription factor n=1 Tax=Cochlodiniinecator piscidefendens TaxID=2715756 RepID=UPI001408141F|nr:response regulator transcription factor [Cochlodiniinecator piscidefendens]